MKNNNSSTIETLQKEINLINQKLEDMHELVHCNHWGLQIWKLLMQETQ
jgi:hypothetical protein